MKIAIVGGGIAGLSCAHELERLGIRPVIYERNSFIGDQISHVAAFLEIVNRPIKDIINYIKEEFDIDIKPIASLNKLTHFSPNKTTIIKGKFGYFVERGVDKESVIVQLYSQLKNSELILSNAPDIEKLSLEYDYVVVASGNSSYAEILGCWQNWLNTYVRGAIVHGDFDIHELKVWVDREYCKRGYAYLTPFNEKKASLLLVTTDVNEKEIDQYWQLFLNRENIKYTIIEEFKLEHISGFAYPHKVDNIYLAGNAGGAIDAFLGFGQLNSIVHGAMAARAIVLNKDYERLIRGVSRKNFELLQFRKIYDKLDNYGYDLLISSLGIPGLKHLAYYTPLNVIKIGAAIAQFIPSKKRNV